jgi:hypothetical protein
MLVIDTKRVLEAERGSFEVMLFMPYNIAELLRTLKDETEAFRSSSKCDVHPY